ncbi:MAG: hypothetical protein ACHQ3P_10565, partial [Candidatus Limnocylindrales bacterium]
MSPPPTSPGRLAAARNGIPQRIRPAIRPSRPAIRPGRPRVRRCRPAGAGVAAALAIALVLGACDAGTPAVTPVPVAGTESHPREINIIAREYGYAPAVIYLVPGETVTIHLVDAGLETHEAVIGDAATQAAWESA